MTKLYTIDVTIYHRVEVEAETENEAEESAYDVVVDNAGNWDDVEFYIAEIEEYEDDLDA